MIERAGDVIGRAETIARSIVMDRPEVEDPTVPYREGLSLDGLIGRSPAMAALLAEVRLVAPLDVLVLVTGPSGTGKSMIARVLHDNSPRAGRPFLEVSCGTLPPPLMESELFGAAPGAHSTAIRRIEGKVAAAAGGTLFLDEIGLLGLEAQAKLLQLLQSRTYFPLGSAAPRRADVRVLAATNVDLEAAVAAGAFREDLYYRLSVMPLRVPSLAERRGDVPLLADHLARGACARHGFPPLSLSGAARGALEAAEWPGNVRQLANVVEAAVIRAAGEKAARVEERHLAPARRPAEAREEQTLKAALDRFLRRFVEEALEAAGWNVSAAARRMGVARSHLYALMHAYGVERREPKASHRATASLGAALVPCPPVRA